MESPAPAYRVFRDQHGIPQFEPKRGTQALKDALIYAFPTLETELQLMQAALRKFFDSERTTQFVCELPENNLQSSLAKKRDVPISPVQAARLSLRNCKVQSGQQTPLRPTSRASSRASSRGRSRTSSRAPSRAETPAQSTILEPLVEVRPGGIMTTWNLSNGQELEKRKRQPYDPVKRRKVAENRGNACDKHRTAKTTCDPDECPDNKIHSKPANSSPRVSSTLRGRVSHLSLSRAMSTTNIYTPDTDGQIMSSGTDTVSRGSPQAEHVSPLNRSESWDPFEQYPMGIKAKSSLLSFSDIASNTDSGYWTENEFIGPTALNSCSYPTFPESFSEQNIVLPGTESSRGDSERSAEQQRHPNAFNMTDSSFGTWPTPEAHGAILPPENSPTLLDETPHDTYTALLTDSPAEILSEQPTQQSKEVFSCSDDPFMGSWDSEKAHHLFDDYGWVLHHVENL